MPVVIDDCDLPPSLTQLKYLDMRDWAVDHSFRAAIYQLLQLIDLAPPLPTDPVLHWSMQHSLELQILQKEFWAQPTTYKAAGMRALAIVEHDVRRSIF